MLMVLFDLSIIRKTFAKDKRQRAVVDGHGKVN